MSANAVFSLPYLGNIEYYSIFTKNSSPIIDLGEHYIKQSYRNRAYILGANGVLALSVPIVKKSGIKQTLMEIEISYETDWQRVHIEAIKSAYGSAPFFEYYFDELATIIQTKHQYLKDLSLALHTEILSFIQVETNFDISETYSECTGADFRNYLQPKDPHLFTHESYTQVFSEKLGCKQNLSIIDLLFNEGPNADSYL